MKLFSSLNSRLKVFRYMIILSITTVIIFLIYNILYFNGQYKQIIQNLNLATEFNFEFRDNIDSKMYLIVIGSATFDSVKPYEDIEDAKELISGLKDTASTKKNEKLVEGTLRLVDILRKRVKDIEEAGVYGSYDANIERLDDNIYITTELIQEKLSEYIYNEARNLEQLRLDIEARINKVVEASVVISISFVIIVWVSIMFFSRSIIKPINNLCDSTKQVGEGDFTTHTLDSSMEELQVLSNHFNVMVEKIESLIEDVKLEQAHLRMTELKLLQAQINPHFLYNTLDTIIWLAEGKQNEQVVEMITALSNFFRTTLSKGKDFISIKEEMSHVESYLQIQQFRYRDILEYEVKYDNEIKQYSILKLTLQPIVENALYHGIKNRRGMGKILINGYQDEDKIIILVSDNGIGMQEEEINHLRKQINRQSFEEDDKGFGLANVNERIHLNYGQDYGLEIKSEYGVGTKIKVVIPMTYKKE